MYMRLWSVCNINDLLITCRLVLKAWDIFFQILVVGRCESISAIDFNARKIPIDSSALTA